MLEGDRDLARLYVPEAYMAIHEALHSSNLRRLTFGHTLHDSTHAGKTPEIWLLMDHPTSARRGKMNPRT